MTDRRTQTVARGEDRLVELWQDRVRNAAVSDAVYATLREAILRGILGQGERLGEEELASRFDVSRTPVREAILRLESEHLAERVARRGLVVSTIAPAEVLDLYVVRQAVDGQAARLAATAAGPPDIARLRWIHAQMTEAAGAFDFATMARLNLEFHEAICRAGRSPLLLFFMQQVHDRVRRFTDSTFMWGDRCAEALREHEQLITAIEMHDPELAHRVAHSHMGRALEIRIEMLGDRSRASGASGGRQAGSVA